ncbi:hypothetical protein LDV99_001631 [Vibrio parahaemolyticus]|uniref:hypothetical protein n=1 Tax=Vibrio parahaemolyticus TaxID=670 RepID=UPI00044CA4CB|nr:hypothetical protein [Vibrio parahaemolyticus]EIE5874804.1 hypothetical protein [Vibrio parahaemolyticus]ETZ09178.1 hypothetical protein AJ90_07530 [Vibrio parahaemolyticus M0605]MBD6964648.1 hypothetical protein [Vibrio parahaemolyticus]
MNEINKTAMELNEECFSVLNEISDFKPQFYHILARRKLREFESQLRGLREKLSDLDKDIAPHTNVPGDYNSIQMAAGKLSVCFNARNVALTTLTEAQRLLSSHEGNAQFKATTMIALIAVIISMISVVK